MNGGELTFPVVPIGEIEREVLARRWLIEGLWGASAAGLIGGQPKLGKTFLALDMAVSVASGTPCLGTYRVLEPGRAVVYHAEDKNEDIRRRAEALTRQRGLSIQDLDLKVIAAPSLRLDLAAHRERLLRTLEPLKARILVLDPLVRLHSRDENDSAQIAELLSYLRDLQRTLDLAVVLVHHLRKSGAPHEQSGLGLRGSGDFWAWLDSGLYLRRAGTNLVLSMEHRAAAAPDPVCLRLVETAEGLAHLEVVSGYTQQKDKSRSIAEAVINALQEAELTREALRSKLSVNNARLGEVLSSLEEENQIERGPRGWRIVKVA